MLSPSGRLKDEVKYVATSSKLAGNRFAAVAAAEADENDQKAAEANKSTGANLEVGSVSCLGRQACDLRHDIVVIDQVLKECGEFSYSRRSTAKMRIWAVERLAELEAQGF
jgi:hypothetical protein